jgi:hypothetical protein
MTTLAELRLANLREQKKSAAEPASSPEPAAVSVPEVKALPEVIASALPAPREDDLVLSQFISEPAAEVAAVPAADPEAERSAALIARVQTLLAHKTLHPNGAKATVDMSPALFHRAKRYCLDHGNVTLRQLFLDLMTAFLDEEGY